MKTFIILAALSIIIGVQTHTIPEELKEKLRGFSKACAAETGVDKTLIEKAKKGEFIEDAKLKEQMYCVSKKIGFQNEAGQLNLDVIKAKTNVILNDVEKTEKLVENCAVQKDTPQETAFHFVKCSKEGSKHVSFTY